MADAPIQSRTRDPNGSVPSAGPFDPARPWEAVTLALSGFNGGPELRPVLRDWFDFLGGRPGEVLYVDGGSGPRTARRLAAMVQAGLIDRLELLHPGHWENSFDRCYIQEYRSGALATLPYILFVKLDMLPWRRGRDDWLARDLSQLDTPGVFAVTNTHLIDPPLGREGEYLVHDFASLNFALMKRDVFQAAMRGQIGDLIDRNFRGPYPVHLQPDERWRRALVEWAWQAHIRSNALRTLAREEGPDWTIYHINKRGQKLLEYRRAYRARRGVEVLFNRPRALYRPPLRRWQRWGRSLEGFVRAARGDTEG